MSEDRAARQLRHIRQAIFDGLMDYYGMDDSDDDDQAEATEITDAIMKRVDLSERMRKPSTWQAGQAYDEAPP